MDINSVSLLTMEPELSAVLAQAATEVPTAAAPAAAEHAAEDPAAADRAAAEPSTAEPAAAPFSNRLKSLFMSSSAAIAGSDSDEVPTLREEGIATTITTTTTRSKHLEA